MRRYRGPALLAALLLSVVVQPAYPHSYYDLTTYNRNNKQLFFRCPKKDPMYPNGKAVFIQLERISPPAVVLANWTSKGAWYHDDRVNVLDAETPLAVRMDHVECRDSATYRCSKIINTRKPIGVYNMSYGSEFKYEAEITPPVLRASPQHSLFKAKDIVTFECKAASIGCEKNTFVWDIKLPGEGYIQINDTGSPRMKIKQETKKKACEIEAVTTLELELNADDHDREYRCRLLESYHSDSYTVSVERPFLDGNNSVVPYRNQSSAKLEEVTASEDVPYDPNPVSNVGASYNKTEECAGPTSTEHGGSGTCPLLPHPAVNRTSPPDPPAATATPPPTPPRTTPPPTTTTPTRK